MRHKLGQTVRGREPRRRRRQPRRRAGVQRRARRLPAHGVAARADHHQLGALQEAQLSTRRSSSSSASCRSIPNVLLVKNDFPAKTAQEFIAYVKANPGKVNYASQGPGTTSHLTAELFDELTGDQADARSLQGHRPGAQRSGRGPRRLHLHAARSRRSSCTRASKARILAVTTGKRLAELPDIPTMDEAGIKADLRHLERDLRAAEDAGADRRQAQHRAQRGAEGSGAGRRASSSCTCCPAAATSPQTRAFIEDDTKRWSDVIRAAKIPQIE